MEEKTVLVVNARPNPDEKTALEAYLSQSSALFKAVGGKPLAKYAIQATIIGDQKFSLVSMLEFPDAEVVKNVFESDAYKQLIPLRDKAFLELNAFITQSLS